MDLSASWVKGVCAKDKGFSAAGSWIWSSCLEGIRMIKKLSTFQAKWKTHFFALLCFSHKCSTYKKKNKKKIQSLPRLKMKEKLLAGRKWLHYFCPYICIYIFIIGGLPLCFLYKSWYLVGWNREANCKRIQENFLHNTHLLPVLHCSDHNSCFAPGLISLWAKQTISPLCVRGTSGVGASCLRNISIGVPPLLSPIPVFLRDYSLEL